MHNNFNLTQYALIRITLACICIGVDNFIYVYVLICIGFV